MRWILKTYPWKNGEGWQEHDIADRTAETVDKVLDEFNQLELSRDLDGMDYSLEVYKGEEKMAEFWLSDFLKNGVVIDGVKYSIKE